MAESAPVRLVTTRERDHSDAQASVVKQLEAWLEIAKRGDLEGIAVAALYSDGTCGHGFSAASSYFRQLGAIVDLQHAYMRANES